MFYRSTLHIPLKINYLITSLLSNSLLPLPHSSFILHIITSYKNIPYFLSFFPFHFLSFRPFLIPILAFLITSSLPLLPLSASLSFFSFSYRLYASYFLTLFFGTTYLLLPSNVPSHLYRPPTLHISSIKHYIFSSYTPTPLYTYPYILN